MLWRSKLALSSAFVMAAALQAYAHNAVELKDVNGNPISSTLDCSKKVVVNGKEHCAGNPVSWEVTCGACHKEVTGDVSSGLKEPGPIHRTYHVGRGWVNMSDSFGAERVKEGKDWRKFIRSFGDDGAW